MKKKNPPQEGQKKKLCAFGADPFPQNLKMEKDGFENFGGSGGGGIGVWNLNRPPPLGGGSKAPPPPSGDSELLEAPKKFFRLN